MKLKMNSKRLDELQSMLNTKTQDKVPKGWFTSEHIASVCEKPRSTTGNMLRKLVKEKVIPAPRQFKIKQNNKVVAVPHYKVDL